MVWRCIPLTQFTDKSALYDLNKFKSCGTFKKVPKFKAQIMAIYHFKTTPISRSNGHSATAKIAYMCRTKIKDEQTGKIHNYSSEKMQSDLVTTGTAYPVHDVNNYGYFSNSEVWNKAEQAENRKDSRVAREFLVALPKELTMEQNKRLTRDFCWNLANKYECFIEFAIHNEKNDNNNLHAHILASTRKFDMNNPKFFTDKTNLELSQKKCKELGIKCTDEQITDLRKEWETTLNKHLQNAELDLSVSCQKKEDRQLVKKHLGKNATALEKKGIKTEKGDYNRQIDNVMELKTQIYNDGDQLAKLNAEIEKLEKEQPLKTTPEIKPQIQNETKPITPTRVLSDIQPMEKPIISQDVKLETVTEIKLPVFRQAATTQIADTKPEVTTDNELKRQSYIDTGKLFDIARQHNDFFNKTVDGWKNKNQHICVQDNKVSVESTFNDKDIQLAIDVAQAKYETLSIRGTGNFQNSVYKELAINPKYQDAKVSDIWKLSEAKQSITANDVLDFYGRTYPKFIDQVKQNGALDNIGNNRRESLEIATASPQEIQTAMEDIILRDKLNKEFAKLQTQKQITNNDIVEYYEKLNPELIEQVRRDGGIDVPGVGGGQWNLEDEDPKYLAQLLGKATGHKIPSLTNNSADHDLTVTHKSIRR